MCLVTTNTNIKMAETVYPIVDVTYSLEGSVAGLSCQTI